MAVHYGGKGPGHTARSLGIGIFDYYVDPVSGSDVAAGTLSAPLATVSRAVTLIGASTNKRVGLKRGTTLRNDPVTATPAGTYFGSYGSGAVPNFFGSSQIAVSSFSKVGNLYTLSSHTYDPLTLALVDGSGNATKLYMTALSGGNTAIDPSAEGEWTWFPGTHASPNLLKFFTAATITGYQVEVPQSGASRTGLTVNGANATVAGWNVRYWTGSGVVFTGDSTLIASNDVSYNGGDGIDSGQAPKNCVISGNLVYYNGQRINGSNGPGDGISFHSGAGQYSSGVVVGNIIVGNTQTGVGNQSGAQVTVAYNTFQDNYHDFNVYNVADSIIGVHNVQYNKFTKTNSTYQSFLFANGNSAAANATTQINVRNNTFYAATGYTKTAGSTIEGFTWLLDSNVAKVPSTVTNFAQIVASAPVTSTNNTINGFGTAVWRTPTFILPGTETGLSTADPLLTNGPSGDYTLQAGSPCINTGTNWGQTRDFTGMVITGTPDRGAFER